MRYTRYDLKKDRGTKTFVFMVLSILAAAFIIGTAASKIFMVNYDVSGSISTDAKSTSGTAYMKAVFTAVQGGMYKDKANAEKEKKVLSNYGTPFTVEEEGKIRVFLGIYDSDKGKNVMSLLSKQKIDNSSMDFTINNDSTCNKEIIEIVNANLKILDKFSESDVQFIKTEELKKWCASLENVDSSSKNFKILKDLKEYVKGLPDKLSRDKSEGSYAYMYSKLKECKK